MLRPMATENRGLTLHAPGTNLPLIGPACGELGERGRMESKERHLIWPKYFSMQNDVFVLGLKSEPGLS